MTDDGTSGWDDNEAGLQNLIDNLEAIERKALRAAAQAVAPRLAEATQVHTSSGQTGEALPAGALRRAVRPRVAKDRKTGRWQAVADFGKFTWIAHIVDIGHRAPNAKLAGKLGKKVGRNTPAHPFVRAVQDSSRETAEAAYREAMTKGMKKALKGGK